MHGAQRRTGIKDVVGIIMGIGNLLLEGWGEGSQSGIVQGFHSLGDYPCSPLPVVSMRQAFQKSWQGLMGRERCGVKGDLHKLHLDQLIIVQVIGIGSIAHARGGHSRHTSSQLEEPSTSPSISPPSHVPRTPSHIAIDAVASQPSLETTQLAASSSQPSTQPTASHRYGLLPSHCQRHLPNPHRNHPSPFPSPSPQQPSSSVRRTPSPIAIDAVANPAWSQCWLYF
jgi:hypothetical protein